jgi:hypothetical protein
MRAAACKPVFGGHMPFVGTAACRCSSLFLVPTRQTRAPGTPAGHTLPASSLAKAYMLRIFVQIVGLYCCTVWRHACAFAVPLPLQKANFMEANATFQYKAKWLRSLHPSVLNNTAFLDEYYRRRLRALRAADDMVDRIMKVLLAEVRSRGQPAGVLLTCWVYKNLVDVLLQH